MIFTGGAESDRLPTSFQNRTKSGRRNEDEDDVE